MIDLFRKIRYNLNGFKGKCRSIIPMYALVMLHPSGKVEALQNFGTVNWFHAVRMSRVVNWRFRNDGISVLPMGWLEALDIAHNADEVVDGLTLLADEVVDGLTSLYANTDSV